MRSVTPRLRIAAIEERIRERRRRKGLEPVEFDPEPKRRDSWHNWVIDGLRAAGFLTHEFKVRVAAEVAGLDHTRLNRRTVMKRLHGHESGAWDELARWWPIVPDAYLVRQSEDGELYVLCVEVENRQPVSPEKAALYANLWFDLDCAGADLSVAIVGRGGVIALYDDAHLTNGWYAGMETDGGRLKMTQRATVGLTEPVLVGAVLGVQPWNAGERRDEGEAFAKLREVWKGTWR